MKKIVSLSLVILSISCFSQSKEVLAKAAFLKAQEAYGNGQYLDAIDRLDKVKEMLGSTNPRVEYLLAQSHFANKDAVNAKASLKAYFEMAADNDPNYNEMLALLGDIDTTEKQWEIEREKELIERADWDNALAANTVEKFNDFIIKYPNSSRSIEARKLILKLPTPPIIDERDGQQYKTVRIGNQVWMAENLRYEAADSELPAENRQGLGYGLYYPNSSTSSICPDGWRIPSKKDILELMEAIGVDLNPPKEGSVNYTIHSDKIRTVEVYSYKTSPNPILDLMSSTGWKHDMGTDLTGFTALPASGIPAMGQRITNFWMQEGKWSIAHALNATSLAMVTFFRELLDFELLPCRCIQE